MHAGAIRQLLYGSVICTGDNQLAKAQVVDYLFVPTHKPYNKLHINVFLIIFFFFKLQFYINVSFEYPQRMFWLRFFQFRTVIRRPVLFYGAISKNVAFLFLFTIISFELVIIFVTTFYTFQICSRYVLQSYFLTNTHYHSILLHVCSSIMAISNTKQISMC